MGPFGLQAGQLGGRPGRAGVAVEAGRHAPVEAGEEPLCGQSAGILAA